MNDCERPWRIHLELTFGCDNRCPMCFKQVLHKEKGNYNYMNTNTAYNIATKLEKAGFDGVRIECALRGEPTLNPNFLKIIQILRSKLKKSQITVFTNGNHLNKDLIKKYFLAGGNILLVDCYTNNLQERLQKYKEFNPINYYENSSFNPFHKNPPNTKKIVLMDSIITQNKIKRTRQLHNQGGNVDFNITSSLGIKPIPEPYNKKCVRPFRELAINYKGNIILCCKDANEDQVMGNINRIQDIGTLWRENKKLKIIRLLLYNKNRNFKPCDKCDDKGGMRIGFLPKTKILDETTLKRLSSYLVQKKEKL